MDAGPDPIPEPVDGSDDVDDDTRSAPDRRDSGPAGPDGGVLVRLSRRTAVVAGVLGLLIVLITATGLVWPGWFATPTGLVLGFVLIIGCAIGAALLLRKSSAWTSLSARTVRESPGVSAAIGDPLPLHGSGPSVVRRRAPAQVVPIRTAAAPWADGAALLVHGRADGEVLRDGDTVLVRWYVSRGPYLLERDDGLVFVAERSTLAAW